MIGGFFDGDCSFFALVLKATAFAASSLKDLVRDLDLSLVLGEREKERSDSELLPLESLEQLMSSAD